MDSSENENLLPFNWKAIVIGIVLTLVLGLILSYLSRALNFNAIGLIGVGFIPLLIGGILTGYLAKGHPMNGAIHGGIVGAVIWLIYILYILYLNQSIILQIVQSLAMSLIGNACIGILGGTIGSLIMIGQMKIKNRNE